MSPTAGSPGSINVDPSNLELLYKYCSLGLLDNIKTLSDKINLSSQKDHVKLRCFYLACAYGHLEVLKWLEDKYSFVENFQTEGSIFWNNCPSNEESYDMICTFDVAQLNVLNFFKIVCEFGHLEVAKWLLNIGLIKLDGNDLGCQVFMASTFVYASRNGKVDILKWLDEAFPQFFNKTPIKFEALYEACGSCYILYHEDINLPHKPNSISEESRLETVNWLVHTTTFPNGYHFDPREKGSISKEHPILKALQRACGYGYSEIVKCLVKGFLELYKRIPIDSKILYEACGSINQPHSELCLLPQEIKDQTRDGRIEMVKLLVQHMKFIATEQAKVAFTRACKHENLGVAEYLIEKFNISSCVRNIEENGKSLFVNLCQYGPYTVAKWLGEKFDLANESLKNEEFLGYIKACQDIEFKKWIVIKLKATPEEMIDIFKI